VLNNTNTQSRPKLLFLVPATSQTHKSLENSQDFLSRPTPIKTFTSRPRPRPRLWVSRPRPILRPRLYFLSSRLLETKTLVSRTTSLSSSRMQMYGVTSGPAVQSRPRRLPLALTLYTSDRAVRRIRSFWTYWSSYADDTQVYISAPVAVFASSINSIKMFVECVERVNACMDVQQSAKDERR